MANARIQRDAHAVAFNGELGRVRHVVIDRETREVTDVVVGHDDQEWLIPIARVSSVEGDRILLEGSRADFERERRFDRDQYHAVDDETAREQSQGQATHGGAALHDADAAAVEVRGLGEISAADPQAMSRQAADAAGESPYRLQLLEERLQVSKEREQVGGATLSKRIVEHIETIEVPVREERVVIERRAGSGPVVVDGKELGEGESIEIPVMKERVTISKEPVVIEEVSVRKETIERVQQVQETLRKEELMVDDTSGVVISDGDSPVREESRASESGYLRGREQQ